MRGGMGRIDNKLGWRALALWALGAGCGLAVSAHSVPLDLQESRPAALDLQAAAPLPDERPASLAGLVTATETRRWSLGSARSFATVVELPPQSGITNARQRAHHALVYSADGPKRMLNSLGLEATDCNVRLRLPSRLRSTAAGVRADVRAQAVFGCQF